MEADVGFLMIFEEKRNEGTVPEPNLCWSN